MTDHRRPEAPLEVLPETAPGTEAISRCSICLTETDEPHIWETCARILAHRCGLLEDRVHDPEAARALLRDIGEAGPRRSEATPCEHVDAERFVLREDDYLFWCKLCGALWGDMVSVRYPLRPESAPIKAWCDECNGRGRYDDVGGERDPVCETCDGNGYTLALRRAAPKPGGGT